MQRPVGAKRQDNNHRHRTMTLFDAGAPFQGEAALKLGSELVQRSIYRSAFGFVRRPQLHVGRFSYL